LNNAIKGDSASISEFFKINYIDNAAGYDHGANLYQVIAMIGDKQSQNALKALEPKEVNNVLQYLQSDGKFKQILQHFPSTGNFFIENDERFIDTARENFRITENKHDPNIYFISSDSIDIPSIGDATNRYGKFEFNNIVKHFPELTNKSPSSPNITYNYLSKIFTSWIDSLGNTQELSFAGEAGQDEYYQLYAYFLKRFNGDVNFKSARKNLVNVYYQINDICETLHRGGTFFGHQYYRIPAIAEYSIYLYKGSREDFVRKYNYSKQKELFIASIRQLVIDEESVNFDYVNSSKKKKRLKELLKSINNLDNLISDYFLLKSAQTYLSEYN
jgi:hypothetical protein